MLVRLRHSLGYLTCMLGILVAPLPFFMAAITCGVVVVRYGLEVGATAWQETVLYMHATVILLAAGWTWARGAQVRIDVLSRTFGTNTQRLVDTATVCLCVWPFAGVLLWAASGYVEAAWQVRERSPETAGLAWVWLLKTLLLVFPILLALQGLERLLHLWLPPATAALNATRR